MGKVSINGERLWQSLMDIAKIGATDKGGSCRLTLTDLDQDARDLFVSWCQAENCRVEIDQMGNIFARRKGTDDDLPAIMTGSHLDTQPTGGKFDGIYGVMAGLEVIRTLNETETKTRHPVDVVVWTNEEGSRFQPAMVGSGVLAGAFDIDEIYECRDRNGKRFGDELKRIGYLGERKATPPNALAYFECHIEQGPILENENKTIGVVTHQQGMRWYEVIVTGAESHAGTTPMPLRKDAMQAAAAIVQRVPEIANAQEPHGRGTVGKFECYPNSPNTIPGRVTFSIDLRHPDTDILSSMHQSIMDFCAEHNDDPCQIHIDDYWYYPPTRFDQECIDAVQSATDKLGYGNRQMITGAGHDASYMTQIIPTSMIFIPCAGGLSHNELESATLEDCAAGCNVLLQAILAMDQR